MNNHPEKTNDPLDNALKTWQIRAALPPGIQEQVWRRIERAEAAPAVPDFWTALQNIFAGLFPRRALAYSYLAIALAVGLTLGQWRAAKETNSVTATLGQKYLASVDPYQKPH